VGIALDGGFPEGTAGTIPGQQLRAGLGRIQPDQGRPASALAETAAGNIRDAAAAQFNADLVRQTFAHVMADAQKSMEYFYARLFAQSPHLRALFPLAMDDLRARVFHALADLIRSIDRPQSAAAYLRQLGRDHRKFGVREKHHQAFFEALLATVEHFSGIGWTAQASAAWEAVLGYARDEMIAAASADAGRQPPWWVGEIVRHERRTGTVAVLTIRPDSPLGYVPGQYLGVQVTRWPRVWRNFSIANAPRVSGLLDLHIRAVPGGMVSNALVHHAGVGDTTLLGPARGEMTVPDDPARDLVCVAGGTGLAPIKAIIESVTGAARPGPRRNITVFVGARRRDDLYDMRDLAALQSGYRSLVVIPVVSHDPGFPGAKGMLPDIVSRHASLPGSDVFISGPDDMVRQTEQALAGRVAAARVHHDPLAAAGAGDPPGFSC
jgi:NAD(P)H-flavin reductase/hemoglobin-like flavoprotein